MSFLDDLESDAPIFVEDFGETVSVDVVGDVKATVTRYEDAEIGRLFYVMEYPGAALPNGTAVQYRGKVFRVKSTVTEHGLSRSELEGAL